MFNYTHEVIVNNLNGTLEASDSAQIFPSTATTSRLAVYTDAVAGVKHLVIERGGDYRADLIFPRSEGVVFKTAPVLAELATATISLDGGSNEGSDEGIEAGDTLQFTIFAKLLDPAALSEYAYPNWASFGKPIVVGLTVKDASKVADELAKAIKEAIPYNNKFVKVTVEDGAVVLTANEEGMEFVNGKLERLVEGACDGCQFDKYEDLGVEIEYTPAVVAFGTGQKLIENYRFPTYANTRWASVNSDEAPVASEAYTMYSFAYDSPRPGLGGLSGVGQKLDAVTRHIYWVASGCVEAFDAALEALGITPTEKE